LKVTSYNSIFRFLGWFQAYNINSCPIYNDER
jgi:hypothetical protein